MHGNRAGLLQESEPVPEAEQLAEGRLAVIVLLSGADLRFHGQVDAFPRDLVPGYRDPGRPASGEAECARQGARDDQRGRARAIAARERRDAPCRPGRQPDDKKCDAAAGADEPVFAGRIG